MRAPHHLMRFTLQKTATPIGSLEPVGTATELPIYIDAAVGNKAAIAFWHAIGFQDYSIGMGLKAGAAPK